MKDEHITIFSGSSIIVKGLQIRLEDNNIKYLIKDRVESARLGGFGEHRTAIELLVSNNDKEKAQPIVDAYKVEINS
ncbi:DUF2007 domain-containing protein [Polaribacter haliotis]|uniref:DUF2007 domain-containing protein n=1 Tax=Polaribacter haliotis TaxID=1888915 RepID=A0A7L8AJD4_9FLAO|nr:DUF2007 domain-containing protein [Polaribacter haliotis]QOD62116.1 DUF2007 domain-containing protein [Polaribacter haliotis]